LDVEDEECSGAPKKFEDEYLEALLRDKKLCQMLAEFAESLRVDHTIVSKHLKVLGMIERQGPWAPYELKLRGVERFLRVNSYFNGRKRKVFCIIS